MTLSLWLGIPLGQLGQHITAVDMATYEAADAVGIVPDFRLQLRMQAAVAGVDIDKPEGEQDMLAGYRMRKAMYGRR